MKNEVKKGQKGLNLSTFHEFSNPPALYRNYKPLTIKGIFLGVVICRAETLDSPLKPLKFEFSSRTKKEQGDLLLKYVCIMPKTLLLIVINNTNEY